MNLLYKSTRNSDKTVTASQAILKGLADDGGLFVPVSVPKLDVTMDELKDMSYQKTAYAVMKQFFTDFTEEELKNCIANAYDEKFDTTEIAPLHEADGAYYLELFHGPTCAFKDFGAGFMGRMTGLLGAADEKLVILTATSGDTGSAVAHGFHNVPGVEVVVLYPEGKISRLQECQMTALGGNIHPLRVAGTFDDCQRLVKELFADAPFRKRRRVTSANSINLLRWIPQAFYYFYGYCQWRQAAGGDRPVVVVPSGNYGNLAAGMLARRMGLPLGGFVAASNVNDVVPEFIRTGVYRPRPSVRTPANAMDVGAPSNFERMLWLCGGDPEALRGELEGFRCDDACIRRTCSTASTSPWGSCATGSSPWTSGAPCASARCTATPASWVCPSSPPSWGRRRSSSAGWPSSCSTCSSGPTACASWGAGSR